MVADAVQDRLTEPCIPVERKGPGAIVQHLPLTAAIVVATLLCGPLPALAEDIAPQALNSLSVAYNINAKPVFDANGGHIGSVASVTPRGDGMLWSVTIRLENGRQVNGQPANGAATQTILAGDASYDGTRVIAEAGAPRG